MSQRQIQIDFRRSQRKVRGKQRRCRALARRLSECTSEFPASHDERGYWHLHLPVAQGFIDAPRIPLRVRRECIQLVLDACCRLCSRRPPTVFARVVAAISTPSLFGSQLIVFYSPPYFDSFFNRRGPEQQWISLPAARSLAREWELTLPNGFMERGFHEHIHDEDFEQDSEIWFFGELT